MTASEYKCICTGFESNSDVSEFDLDTAGAAVTIQGTTVLSGTYSCTLNYVTAIDSRWHYAHSEGTNYFVGSEAAMSGYFKLRITGTPSKAIAVGVGIQFTNVQFGMNTSRQLTMYYNGTTITSSTALTAGVMYEISFLVAVNDKVYLRINAGDEGNITWASTSPSTPTINGGADNSGKGGTGYGIDWIIDDLVYLYTNKAGVQTPWITPQIVKNLLPNSEANYTDSTATGIAHPNAHQNVDDYGNTADYNTLGSTSAVKRDTYKLNYTITLTGANVFNGFTAHVYLRANNSPSAVAPILIRDNATDISTGRAVLSTEVQKCFGYWKYRPSDDTVALTKAMLENTSGNNIEFGLYVPIQSGGTMTYDIYSAWATYFEGDALTDVSYTAPASGGKRSFAAWQ